MVTAWSGNITRAVEGKVTLFSADFGFHNSVWNVCTSHFSAVFARLSLLGLGVHAGMNATRNTNVALEAGAKYTIRFPYQTFAKSLGNQHNKARENTMITRAAVAVAAGKPLEVMDVNLEGPKAGEVLIEIKATGICHTDEFTLSGDDPEGMFPAILGHEGAGVVVEIGEGVTSLEVGDHVIPLYTPECRECEYCLNPKTNLCQKIRSTQGAGVMPDGTTRFSMMDGTPILHYMGCSTFANHTVMPEIALAKVRKDAPFDKICYIGCGVTTGIGAVINTAKVEIGSTAIVFGLGGIGLNVVQGLRLAGADQIVGVDLNESKVALATEFGMTDFVNPSKIDGDLVAYLVELTGGGGDYTFDATGNTAVMRDALESAPKGWGESIIIGVAAAGAEISTRPFQLVTGRVWRGTAFGGASGRTDVPKIVDWYMDGKIEIDQMITHKLKLEDINKGFDLMHEGKSIRAVVEF
jgi:S-(hydroxymethyl)glutathione dehydrogenase/alcohol dehydrogenase